MISATHGDLRARIEHGQFRRDLYYRLCGFVLPVPPAARAPEDIAGLAEGILRPLAVASAKPIRGVTAEALRALVATPGPATCASWTTSCSGSSMPVPPARPSSSACCRRRSARRGPPPRPSADGTLELQRHVDALENRLIAEALARTQGNRTEAARLLAISRNGLALKMARLGLDD